MSVSALDLFPLCSQVPHHKSFLTKRGNSLFSVLVSLTAFHNKTTYPLIFNDDISGNLNCEEESFTQNTTILTKSQLFFVSTFKFCPYIFISSVITSDLEQEIHGLVKLVQSITWEDSRATGGHKPVQRKLVADSMVFPCEAGKPSSYSVAVFAHQRANTSCSLQFSGLYVHLWEGIIGIQDRAAQDTPRAP